jgi:hypothetical protein
MVKRFVAELLRKQILCAGSELSTRVLRKVFSPTLFPINVAVASNIIGETSNKMSGFASGSAWPSFLRPISVVSANHYEPLVGQHTLLRFLRYMPYAALGMVLSEEAACWCSPQPE